MKKGNGTYNSEELHLLTADGKPFEGETRVQLRGVVEPFHFFHGGGSKPGDPRLIVEWEPLDFPGKTLKRYYPVRCKCGRTSGNCRDWTPKGARSGLCQDASVALGRLPRHGDQLHPKRLFEGRIFRALIGVVKTGQHRDPRTGKQEILPECAWYSKISRLVVLEAGGRPS